MKQKRHFDSLSVLLNRGFVTPMRWTSDGKMAIRDGSFLVVLIEELIALSASRLVLLDNNEEAAFLEVLPKNVQQHIQIVSQSEQETAVNFREGLFAPILRDFGIENPYPAALHILYLRNCKDSVNDKATLRLLAVYEKIGIFFLGITCKLAVEVDIAKLARDTRALRKLCRDAKHRMQLAELEGILNSYKFLRTPALKAVPMEGARLAEAFQQLLEDESYRELSHQAGYLALSTRLRRSLTIMRRLAKEIVSKSIFKHVFDVGTKGITIATHIPTPSSAISEIFTREAYLPSIISLDDALERARQTWDPERLDFIPHPLGAARIKERERA